MNIDPKISITLLNEEIIFYTFKFALVEEKYLIYH
jgi:hypothetical protein